MTQTLGDWITWKAQSTSNVLLYSFNSLFRSPGPILKSPQNNFITNFTFAGIPFKADTCLQKR